MNITFPTFQRINVALDWINRRALRRFGIMLQAYVQLMPSPTRIKLTGIWFRRVPKTDIKIIGAQESC